MPYLKERRDGRAVECTGLENQQTFAGFQGSNPCLSASFSYSNWSTAMFLALLLEDIYPMACTGSSW